MTLYSDILNVNFDQPILVSEKLVIYAVVYVNALSINSNLKSHHENIEVEEVSTSGSVQQLRFTNKSNHYILLPAGLVINAGKQTRKIYISVILAPGETRVVAVRCIEKDRWDSGPTKMYSSGEITPSKFRFKKLNQSTVWADATRELTSLGYGDTSSLYDVSSTITATCGDTMAGNLNRISPKIKELQEECSDLFKQIKPVEGQIGHIAVVRTRNQVVSEVYENNELYSKYRDALIRSLLNDCVTGEEEMSDEELQKKSQKAGEVLSEITRSKKRESSGKLGGMDYEILRNKDNGLAHVMCAS